MPSEDAARGHDPVRMWVAVVVGLVGLLAALLASVLVVRANAGSTGNSAAPPGVSSAATATLPIAGSRPPILTIAGTRFVASGHPITLVGVSHSALEYACAGDGHFSRADDLLMKSWGMNVVRIPLSSAYWNLADGVCPTYRLTVASAVTNARSAGLFVILDLQWSAPVAMLGAPANGGAQCPMPDAGADLAMWRDLATLYRGDTGVLFDLYGEPHNISWSTWHSGGTLTLAGQTACYDWNSPGAIPQYGTYTAMGMRTLVANIRAIAPNNILILSGLNWGYDLSGIPTGYAVPGHNIAYATHPWDTPDKQPLDWQRAFGKTAASYPVLVDEFGEYDCGTSYVATAISYFNAHHLSWLAWKWQPGPCSGSGATVLASWSGTPNGPYGTYIRAQMLALARSNP